MVKSSSKEKRTVPKHRLSAINCTQMLDQTSAAATAAATEQQRPSSVPVLAQRKLHLLPVNVTRTAQETEREQELMEGGAKARKQKMKTVLRASRPGWPPAEQPSEPPSQQLPQPSSPPPPQQLLRDKMGRLKKRHRHQAGTDLQAGLLADDAAGAVGLHAKSTGAGKAKKKKKTMHNSSTDCETLLRLMPLLCEKKLADVAASPAKGVAGRDQAVHMPAEGGKARKKNKMPDSSTDLEMQLGSIPKVLEKTVAEVNADTPKGVTHREQAVGMRAEEGKAKRKKKTPDPATELETQLGSMPVAAKGVAGATADVHKDVVQREAAMCRLAFAALQHKHGAQLSLKRSSKLSRERSPPTAVAGAASMQTKKKNNRKQYKAVQERSARLRAAATTVAAVTAQTATNAAGSSKISAAQAAASSKTTGSHTAAILDANPTKASGKTKAAMSTAIPNLSPANTVVSLNPTPTEAAATSVTEAAKKRATPMPTCTTAAAALNTIPMAAAAGGKTIAAESASTLIATPRAAAGSATTKAAKPAATSSSTPAKAADSYTQLQPPPPPPKRQKVHLPERESRKAAKVKEAKDFPPFLSQAVNALPSAGSPPSVGLLPSPTLQKGGLPQSPHPGAAPASNSSISSCPWWFTNGDSVVLQLAFGQPGAILEGSAQVSVCQGELEVMGKVLSAESPPLALAVGGRGDLAVLLQARLPPHQDGPLVMQGRVVVALKQLGEDGTHSDTQGTPWQASLGAERSRQGTVGEDTARSAPSGTFQLYRQGDPAAPPYVEVSNEWQAALHHLVACSGQAAAASWRLLAGAVGGGCSAARMVVAVCGPKGAGKSTFTRLLVNSLLNVVPTVAYLDTDCGQPEFTPPGMVSLHGIKSPVVGAPWVHPHQPMGARFLGDLSPSGHPVLILKAVDSLAGHWARGGIQDGGGERKAGGKRGLEDGGSRLETGEGGSPVESPLSPMVVNTCGWVNGLGLWVLSETLKLVGVTHIVELQGRGMVAKKNLPGGDFWHSQGLGHASVLTVPAAALAGEAAATYEAGHMLEPPLSDLATLEEEVEAVNSKKAASRPLPAIQSRALQMLAFAKECMGMNPMDGTYDGEDFARVAAALCSHPPFHISMDDVSIASPLCSLPPGQEARILNGTLVGLCSSSRSPPAQQLLGRSQVAEGQLQCLGLGLVRLADGESRQLYILTPVDEELLEAVDVLLVGKLTIPMALLQTPGMLSPYHALSCLSTAATGAGAIYSRKNLLRMGHAR